MISHALRPSRCAAAAVAALLVGACRDDAGSPAGAGPPPPVPGPPDYPAWPIPNAAGSGLPNPARYTLEDDAAVRDDVTGLTWMRAASSASYAFDQAPGHCESEAAARGQPWRLPSRAELLSIVDPSRRAPAIDPVAFPGSVVDFFWTSTPVALDARLAWAVFFLDGAAVHTDRLLAARVRCVRGPAAPGGGPQAEEGEVVRFPETRATWHRRTARSVSQAQAAAHCASLGAGWRLPSAGELESIVHVGRIDPAVDPGVFPDIHAETYWTSTPIVAYPGLYWGVSFATGQSNYNLADNLLGAVCTR